MSEQSKTGFWVHVAGPIEAGLIFVNNRPPSWYDEQAAGWTHYPVASLGKFKQEDGGCAAPPK